MEENFTSMIFSFMENLFMKMSVNFFKAKNSSLCAEINGIKLNSAYDPEKEAERFVCNIKQDFRPSRIFFLEPCIPYAVHFLNQKFKNIPLTIIRYTHSFDSFNDSKNKTIFFENENQFQMELSFFREEDFFSSFFIEWPSSKNAFSEISRKVHDAIKKQLDFSKTLLVTRNYFSSRWFKNKIIFSKYAQNIFTIKKGSQDILITASGESLEYSIEKIKELRKHFFLIALSSSLECLLYNKITPDAVLSTDGGYYAEKHISSLEKHNIPLIISMEARCQKKILEKNPLIPLFYEKDYPEEKEIQEIFKIPAIKAERNGTVSGTALILALSLTDGNVFFSGLDLYPSKAFQHANPNNLEILDIQNETRIKNKVTTLSKKMFNCESLKIYENWFKSNSKKFEKRVFRLSDNFCYKNSLNFIKDINFSCAEKIITKNPKKIIIEKTDYKKDSDFKNKMLDFLSSQKKNSAFIKNTFPLESVIIEKTLDENEKNKKIENLNEKTCTLIKKSKDLIL